MGLTPLLVLALRSTQGLTPTKSSKFPELGTFCLIPFCRELVLSFVMGCGGWAYFGLGAMPIPSWPISPYPFPGSLLTGLTFVSRDVPQLSLL